MGLVGGGSVPAMFLTAVAITVEEEFVLSFSWFFFPLLISGGNS